MSNHRPHNHGCHRHHIIFIIVIIAFIIVLIVVHNRRHCLDRAAMSIKISLVDHIIIACNLGYDIGYDNHIGSTSLVSQIG